MQFWKPTRPSSKAMCYGYVNGNVTRLVMPGYLSITPWFAATVVDLSNYAMIGKPASATDYLLYEDIAVTPNSTYTVGFAGFPDLVFQGTVVATITYSVGDQNSPGAPAVFDNILPATRLPVSAVSTTSMVIEENTIPLRKFNIPNFSIPINTLVHACVNVSVIATGNYTFACTDGIVYNPYPPLDGIVDVASTNGFIVTASSIEVSWNGFYVKDWIEPGDDGIAYYTLGVGSYIGWDDVVSTMVIPKTQRKAVSYASLIAGDALYVTVRGYSYAGLAATTYSEALMVDYTAPKSVRGIIDAKAVPTDQDGFYDIVIEFGKFEDNESGLTSVQWVLESEYGLEDVVSLRKTNSPTYIKQAKVELSSAVTYVARIIATNAAGLKQQLVALITADVDLRLLYVTDLRSGGTWTAFSASEKSYTFAWNFTGEASYLEAAVGSASRMSDVMPWTYIDAEARNFTLDLSAFPLTDGALLHATVHAFDAAGKFADSMSSSGIVIDSTPPQIGRVVQGITPFVHHPWTKYPDLVQASWTGFFDADSDLVSIKVCVDNSPSTNPTTSCSNLDWTNAAKLNSTHAVVVDLVLEHWLQPATSYFVKVMATNGAGLISVGVSPAFAVDLEEPIGTSINVGFPSLEANSSTVDGGYFDRTVVQVHWHFQAAPASGISHFLVGIYDVASSTPMTTPAKVPSSVTSWTFSTAAKTLILEFNEGVSYYAVVRGVSGSGMIGDVKSSEFMVMSTRPLVNQPSLRFENFMEPGANSTADVNSPYYAIPIGFNVTGPNDSANATVDVIVYNVGGTTTTSMGPIKYLVHLGSYKYGRNMVNYTLNQTCDSPCSVSFRVPSVNNSMYWASLVSVDAAGLQSDIETVGNFWNGNETPYATNNGSLWVVDGMEPLVIDFNATSPDSITFTGSGLPGFETPTPQDDCDFTYPDGTVLQGPSSLVVVDGIARLTCTPPTLAATAVAALPAEAYVEITIEAGLTLRVPHKRGAGAETIWDPEFVAKVGLSVYENSYRSSPWTWLVNWSNTSADDIAYFTVIGFGTAMITVPGFQTHALFTIALTSAQEMEAKPGNFSWVVCAFPFVNATQSTCFPSELVQVDLMMASVNPEISTGYEDQIPTAVRVQSSSIDSFDYESIQYQSSTTSISLNWTNSFVFASPSNKTVARYDLSIGHAPYERDQDMQLHIVDGQVSTANIPANLVIGIPYFATLVVWDAAGLPSMHVSFPITADESPPASGRVYAGKTPYVMGKRYQNDTSHLFSYWRGFSEPQSVIKGYSYYLCTAANATSCFAGPQWNGMQTRVNATGLNLVQGQTYFVGVEAHNAVGNISDLAFSPGVVIDLTPPSLVDILFGDGGPVANAANTSYSLTWRFSDDESPIVNYHIQMGTIDGGPQYYPWTSISTRNSLPLAGFRLIHNSTVFATVVATNAAGWTTAAKASVRVDLTPPLITGAVQVLDGSGYHQESGMVTVEADWAGVFADPESEIVDYHVAFGRANNPDFYLAGSSLGVLTTCSRSMTVPDGDSLIVTVTATNAAGLSTIARSSPVLFSTNVPSSFTVRLLDSGLNLLLADNNTSLHHVDPSMDVLVRLVGLQDVESGLSSLRVRLLQDSAPVFDWVDMPVQEIIRLSTPELAAGNSTFQVAVQAVNNVNLTSEALSDNFVVIV
ncbi:hypothetical protein DFS34DRAFT_482729 [Phlyctochytrium arcticum]|nr:hypothetical protein DFS34DRAFT_482729 [Phlyctochytrium arcticum]